MKVSLRLPIALFTILALSVLGPAFAKGPKATTKRPIQDFLDAQGGCWLIYFDSSTDRFTWVDYPGYQQGLPGVAPYEYSGGVTERPLANGWTRVTVNLHLANAVTWVTDGFGGPMLLGHSPAEIEGGAAPTQGTNAHYKIVFERDVPPGEPLPNLCNVFFPADGDPMKAISDRFTTYAQGPLRTDSGYPEGTPGAVQMTMRGLFAPPGEPGSDNYPVHHVHLLVLAP